MTNRVIVIADPEDKMVYDKDQSALVRFEPNGTQVFITYPVTVKRERSENDSIYVGARSGVKVNIRKDGKPSLTWTVNKDKALKVGKAKLKEELISALDAVWEHIS